MTKLQKLLILEKIAELDKQNIDILSVDSELFRWFLKSMPRIIQKRYDGMICNKIPF